MKLEQAQVSKLTASKGLGAQTSVCAGSTSSRVWLEHGVRGAVGEMEPGCHVRRLRFYPESNGELLEGFRHGNHKVRFPFGKHNSGSSAN